jgi:dCTP deaminase
VILSNRAIFEALDDGRLEVDPEPTPRLTEVGGPPSPFGTSSVDLTLGPFLQVPQQAQIAIDLRAPGSVASTLSTISRSEMIDPAQGFRLNPGDFVLGQSLERVRLRLPSGIEGVGAARPALAARVEGKSSRARFGILVHFTAPTIHAGWEGPITLEISCLGRNSFILYPGLPICQLIIEEVSGAPISNQSQFHQQQTPAGDR